MSASTMDKSWSEASPNDESLDPNARLGMKITPNPLLEGISSKIIKQAWFIMAHLVLQDGAKVINMRSSDGAITYAMAAMNPQFEFIGIDRSQHAHNAAKEKYQLPNLSFKNIHIQENFTKDNSVDAIINCFNLHEIYSENSCNPSAVASTMERQFKLLKKDGYLFNQGYLMPPEEEFILIEMPDVPSTSDAVEDLSEVDLLLLYAEQARPRENDSYRGFYLEELPARFPQTRLFRLPYKWAYEFILRKDNRIGWNQELHKEYSFFNRNDFGRVVRSFGARKLYSAPHWDNEILENHYKKRMRLFKEDGEPLGTPETSFVIVAQKSDDRESLTLEERRPAHNEELELSITGMRDDVTGRMQDVVSRNIHLAEILPYRVTPDGRLHVFVHEGIPRCLANTIPRNGPNIDGKQWSGHMTETFSIPRTEIEDLDLAQVRPTLNFCKGRLGLIPEIGQLFDVGPGFYPAPDCIDEHVKTLYINVRSPDANITPQDIMSDASGFSTKGRIRELDAQQILNAIGVGLVPFSRLEIQILGLYDRLDIGYQAWAQSPLTLETESKTEPSKLEEYLAKLADEDDRYKEVKATAGQIKTMQSVFVDEGLDKGGVMGLASKSKEFILNEEGSMNTAVVLPLCKGIGGEVMAGMVEQYLPVPQRYKGNGLTLGCPSFPLPPDITNIDQTKQYIADKFEVPVEHVARMGESYFSHIGITPQRIYPFAVSSPSTPPVQWETSMINYSPLDFIYRIMYDDVADSHLLIVSRCYQAAIGMHSDMSAQMTFTNSHADRKASFMDMSMNSFEFKGTSTIKNDLNND